jgi:hypothetical protein
MEGDWLFMESEVGVLDGTGGYGLMEVGLVVGNRGKGVFELGFFFPCRNLVIHTDFLYLFAFFYIKVGISKKLLYSYRLISNT